MGVPKFFRWISERYPCLSETVKEYQIPDFDNLYLDMNGIIHTCSHPDDSDPHFRITEKKIFEDIFHYIEILFRMIQPQKLFFMAVDGVAPRAKMNQQRGRRFRSAKEAQILEKKAMERGEALPKEERFDSNCITPGTEFMVRLQEQLKYFVTYKISTDPSWQQCEIILSGHETPGEGEHKIMDYIRYMKSQPDYDPNTRHCLYGLDADLIMLGLCTHEPHFSLLREEVKFGKNQKKAATPEETKFFLLHLSLLRDYLELEFGSLKEKLKFPFDVEKLIDDWVLMGFLVGNDFIPHLPHMHINNGALAALYKAYIEALPKLDGYINEGGTLNLKRFEQYLKHLSSLDIETFRDTYEDLKYMESKMGRKFGEKRKGEDNDSKRPIDSDLQELIDATNALVVDVEQLSEANDSNDDDDSVEFDLDEEEADDNLFHMEFTQHKEDYYRNKLEYKNVDRDVMQSQAEGYIRAIQWNLNYYYNGICSWSWFYPHNYAPYTSDVKDFSDMKIEFDLAKPFLPYEQLLAVLPSASKKLLPEAYQNLMVDQSSPIIEYYPTDFKTDLNGKKQEWEAVVLIPFIDEKELLKAMEPCTKNLTKEEKRRNTHGPMLVYQYTDENLGPYNAPEYFTPVGYNHAKVTLVWRDEIHVDRNKLVKGLCPGVKLDVYFPGFPTLKHIKHTSVLKHGKVKVFEQASRGENMILQIVEEVKKVIKDVAKELVGKTIFVAWPHLIEAKVVSVSTRETRYSLKSDENNFGNIVMEELNDEAVDRWKLQRTGIKEQYMNSKGIEVGDTTILVHALNMMGRKYVFGAGNRFTIEKEWAPSPTAYALQAVVKDIAVHDPTYTQYKSLQEVFTPGSVCFMLGQPHYGAMGHVTDSPEGASGRVKVSMSSISEPKFDDLMSKMRDVKQTSYMNGNTAAMRVGISGHLLSRVTGSIFIVKSTDNPECHRTNIGLNLKFNKKNEEVPGYTRKDGNMWLYSNKTVELIRNYIEKYPELFDYLSQNTGNDIFHELDIFPNNPGRVSEIVKWLKEQPFYQVERCKCGSMRLEPENIEEIDKHVENCLKEPLKVTSITMQVKPHLLYKPGLKFGSAAPDPKADYRLMDRIVNVRENYTVPLGYRGTIIGIHEKENEDDMYEVLFDKPFPGALSYHSVTGKGYRMHHSAMINVSYGERTQTSKNVVVRPQPYTPVTTTQTQSVNRVDPPPPGFNQINNNNYNHGMWNGQQHMPQYMPPPVLPVRQPSAFVTWNNKPLLRSFPYMNQPPPHQYQPNSMPFLHHPPHMEYISNNPRYPNVINSQVYTRRQEQNQYRQEPHQYRVEQNQYHQDQNQIRNSLGLPPQQHIQQKQLQEFGQKPTPAQRLEYTILPRNQPLPPGICQKSAADQQAQKPSSDYQAVWGSLQKSGVSGSSSPLQSSSTPSNSSAVGYDGRQQNSDDKVNLMKKVMRTPQSGSPQDNVKKLSVDELFQLAARTPELKKPPNQSVPSAQAAPTVQLLTLCQQQGLGIPIYNYTKLPEYSKEIATVKVANFKVFEGDVADSRNEATESAARRALNFIRYNLVGAPQQPNLPDPPETWHHSPVHYNQIPGAARLFQDAVKPILENNSPSSQKSEKQFVPLQAVKTQIKPNQSDSGRTSPSSKSKMSSKVQPKNELVKSAVKNEVGNSSSAETPPSTVKPLVQKPRKSRIAAKFSMNSQTS